MSRPFALPASTPGHGTIHLALLAPNTPKLRTVNYQYPLKLVAPLPIRIDNGADTLVHTVYLLTYGGGLVAGDAIDLKVVLEARTRLSLLTQGSTKLFKSPSQDVVSRQGMNVSLAPGSALCYLPDPVQPFRNSSFEQLQVYNINLPESAGKSSCDDKGGLCVLDWVSNGRPANGEDWSFFRYGSRNEVYASQPNGARKLLLRDNMVLNSQHISGSMSHRMHGLAVYGTLILNGDMFAALSTFFLREFKALPRIGNRKWDSGSDDEERMMDPVLVKRLRRQQTETASKVLWSAASIRGCVVVKFGAPTVEAGRRWLWTMLSDEGSIVEEFGERALLCLR
ncbi:UreD-domain-containing protein [Cercospora zeina]